MQLWLASSLACLLPSSCASLHFSSPSLQLFFHGLHTLLGRGQVVHGCPGGSHEILQMSLLLLQSLILRLDVSLTFAVMEISEGLELRKMSSRTPRQSKAALVRLHAGLRLTCEPPTHHRHHLCRLHLLAAASADPQGWTMHQAAEAKWHQASRFVWSKG